MGTDKRENLSASLEDYVEVIFNLANETKIARSKDIAQALGVAKPSVTSALKLLAEKGLVNYKPYGYVTLTESGLSAAASVARKHDIINSFFVNVLGVDKSLAQNAACKAEHTLGPQIVSRLLYFIEFVTRNNKKGCNLADEFKQFCKNKRL